MIPTAKGLCKRRLFVWLLIAIVAAGSCWEYYLYFQSDDFFTPLAAMERWNLAPLDPQHEKAVGALLSDRFVYLAEGGQMVAFTSSDGRYVLKLFKFHRFRPSPAVELCADLGVFPDYCRRHIAKYTGKLTAAFEGMRLAYSLNHRDSGLLYLQLNPSSDQRFVQIVDKAGHERQLPLEKLPFLLQERGEILSNALAARLDSGSIESAQELLQQLYKLYSREFAMGIYDADRGIMHNIGVVEGRLIHLDVGRLIADPQVFEPAWQQQELARLSVKLHSWLQRHYPNSAECVIQGFAPPGR
jgi:hypothetical protein